jgi:hypothetical protein
MTKNNNADLSGYVLIAGVGLASKKSNRRPTRKFAQKSADEFGLPISINRVDKWGEIQNQVGDKVEPRDRQWKSRLLDRVSKTIDLKKVM